MKTFSSPKTINRVVLIPVHKIDPNPAQPRVQFGAEEIASLAESIRQNGLLQPLTVRFDKRTGRYTLISGERRLRAIKETGLSDAPCIVLETTDRQAAVFALIENIERENLNYFEEAAAIQNLMAEWGLPQQELGEKLGRAQSTIANKLRLLRFSDEEREALLSARLSERHARAMIRLSGTSQFQTAMARVIEHRLSAEETEEMTVKLAEQLPKDEKETRRRRKPIIKDVRLFLNTMNRAVSVMRESGLDVQTTRTDREGYTEYVIRIPT